MSVKIYVSKRHGIIFDEKHYLIVPRWVVDSGAYMADNDCYKFAELCYGLAIREKADDASLRSCINETR